jgi:hypothetical protein
VGDLSTTQAGPAIELRFTPPDVATDGELLTKPLEIEIFRSIASTSTKPGANPSAAQAPEMPSAPLITLKGTGLSRHAVNGKIEYRDEVAPADFSRLVGSTLTFGVRGLTRGFRGRPIESALSNTAQITLLDVPRPVQGLAVEVTESALELRWTPPEETMSGRPAGAIAGYRVYRSETGKPGSYRPVGEAREPSYGDAAFEFGHFYVYTVRVLAREDGHSAESLDSTAVEVVPRDTFPPAAPTGLTGLYTSGAVELIWNVSTEPDLAGYNIYRREEGGHAERINSELLRSPLFHDTAFAPGPHSTYWVTAVDLSGNESPASAEVEVEIPSTR